MTSKSKGIIYINDKNINDINKIKNIIAHSSRHPLEHSPLKSVLDNFNANALSITSTGKSNKPAGQNGQNGQNNQRMRLPGGGKKKIREKKIK